MYIQKDYIRLITGIAILVIIFACIFITSCIQKNKDLLDLVNAEQNYSDQLSPEFTSEVLDGSQIGAKETKVSNDGKVIGINLSYSSKHCFQIIKDKLEKNNWHFVESGSDTSASFYKTYGTYTWLFVNCIEAVGQTSVVMTVD